MRAAIHFQRLIKGHWDRGDNLLKAFYDRHHLSACGEGFRRVFMFLHWTYYYFNPNNFVKIVL